MTWGNTLTLMIIVSLSLFLWYGVGCWEWKVPEIIGRGIVSWQKRLQMVWTGNRVPEGEGSCEMKQKPDGRT